MALVGYPDWERVQREGGDLVAIENAIITAPTELGPFNVQQWTAIRVQVNSTGAADDQTVAVNWYDTISKTNLLSTQPFTVQHGRSLGISLIVQGPYLDVVITPKNGTATSNFELILAGLRSIPTEFAMLPISIPLVSDSHSYAISGISLFVPPIYYGNVIFHVAPQVNPTTQVTVSRFDLATNAFIPIYQWQSILVAAPLIVTLSLPLCLINVQVGNGAVGAQTITTTMMPAM